MFKLEREKGISTPHVVINEEEGHMLFEGESFPENVITFYKEITEWLYAYLKTDFGSFTFDCELVYFNSSTAKVLLNMFSAMDKAAASGKRVFVNWKCSSHNEIILECAETFYDEFDNIKFKILRVDNM